MVYSVTRQLRVRLMQTPDRTQKDAKTRIGDAPARQRDGHNYRFVPPMIISFVSRNA